MKKIDVGQLISILANIGVILGILLLVFELTQNRDMMRAQIRNDIAAAFSSVAGPTVNDPKLADLVIRANSGETLTAAEALRVAIQDQLVVRYWENVHYQYREGLYDDAEFSGHRASMVSGLGANPHLVDYWCQEKSNYSLPFIEFVDELLNQDACRGE